MSVTRVNTTPESTMAMKRALLVLMFVAMPPIDGHMAFIEVQQYHYLSEIAEDGSGDVSEPGVCLTSECVSTASDLLESLDNSTDPCEDFYQFACGGWVKRQMLPPHRASIMTLYNKDQHLAAARNLVADKPNPTDLEAVKKAKLLYASCINHATGTRDYKSLVNVIKERFGEWPLTRKDYHEEEFNLQRFLSEAIKLGVHPLFRLQVELHYVVDDDGKFHFYHVFKLRKPNLGLPINKYDELSKGDLMRHIYVNKIYADAGPFNIEDLKKAEADALEILEVERTLAELRNSLDESDENSNRTLGMLDDSFGKLLNWTEFVSSLGSSPDIGVTDIDSEVEVIVENPQFLYNLTEYFTRLPVRTQANYIIWRVVDSLETVLIKERNKMDAILKRMAFGITAQPSPEESCVAYVSKVFELVVHRLLYTNLLPPEEITTVTRLLKQIQTEFDQLVDEHAWVDSDTLKVIKAKNAAIAVILVNFEKSMNDTFLDIYYRNVTVDEKDFFSNVIVERREAFARNLRSIEKPYERTADALPLEFVAQNFLNENKLEFTSIMFEPPLLINNVPMSVNYAGTGMIFGHEIVHAFDNSGIHYNKEGAYGVWWNNETLQVFIERAQCLVDQYNKFFYTRAGKHVNGQLTLGENIADNAGIKLAYRAYKKHVGRQGPAQLLPAVPFNDEQVFFVKFAQNWCGVATAAAADFYIKDSHSPNEFRVIGALQNSKDFAGVFNCPVGSRMNPEEKCQVW